MTSDKPAGHVSFHLKIADASSASSYFSGGVQYISSMKLASQDQLIIHQDQTYLCAFATNKTGRPARRTNVGGRERERSVGRCLHRNGLHVRYK